jgi:peptidoglycan/LPS O-acetylase OafA/YrhL
VRVAGWISAVQGLIGVGVAVALLVRAVGGHREETVVISGYGTAIWFAILGGGLLAAGIGLLQGRRWGRGLVVIAQLLLLFVAWYVGVGSQQYLAGIALAVVCAIALVSLFRRDAIEWYAV